MDVPYAIGQGGSGQSTHRPVGRRGRTERALLAP